MCGGAAWPAGILSRKGGTRSASLPIMMRAPAARITQDHDRRGTFRVKLKMQREGPPAPAPASGESANLPVTFKVDSEASAADSEALKCRARPPFRVNWGLRDYRGYRGWVDNFTTSSESRFSRLGGQPRSLR